MEGTDYDLGYNKKSRECSAHQNTISSPTDTISSSCGPTWKTDVFWPIVGLFIGGVVGPLVFLFNVCIEDFKNARKLRVVFNVGAMLGLGVWGGYIFAIHKVWKALKDNSIDLF